MQFCKTPVNPHHGHGCQEFDGLAAETAELRHCPFVRPGFANDLSLKDSDLIRAYDDGVMILACNMPRFFCSQTLNKLLGWFVGLLGIAIERVFPGDRVISFGIDLKTQELAFQVVTLSSFM